MPIVSAPPTDPAVAAALAALGGGAGAPLRLGGLDVAALAADFGTPFYGYDAAVLRARLAAVQAAMGPRVEVLWSVKANPSLAVTHCLAAAGATAEIASAGELQVALAAGLPPAALRFAGPGKRDDELQQALAAGLGCFHVESLDELAALGGLAAARGVRADVALRVNLPQPLDGARLRMGGASSRFGIDAAQVPGALQQLAATPSLRLQGLHVYGGTQCFAAAAFLRHAERLCAAAAAWEHELGVRFDSIDLGGGFGVAAFAGDPQFDLDAAGAGVQALLAAHDAAVGPRRFCIELGRFLCAPAGVYVSRVVRHKHSGGRAHAVLDGGLHQAAAATGLGSVLRRTPLLVRVDGGGDGEPVTVGGPLCTPVDQFGEDLPLGPLRTGDLVAVLHAGAYGLSFSPHSFLGHPTPAEVMVDGGTARLIRARGSPADAVRGQAI